MQTLTTVSVFAHIVNGICLKHVCHVLSGGRGTDILSAGDDLSYHFQRVKRIAFFFSPLLSKRHTNRQSKTVKAIAMELLRELFSPRTEYPLRLLLFYLSLFFSISISLRSFWDPGVCWVRSGGAVGSCK